MLGFEIASLRGYSCSARTSQRLELPAGMHGWAQKSTTGNALSSLRGQEGLLQDGSVLFMIDSPKGVILAKVKLHDGLARRCDSEV